MIGGQSSDRIAPRLLHSASVYAASNILQRLVPVLLLPILTFYLSAADVGMIAIFTATIGIASPLVGVNISYAIRRRYFSDDRDFPTYVANCLVILAGGTTLGLGAAWLLGPAMRSIGGGMSTLWLEAAVLLAALQELLMVPLTIWQVEHQAWRYAWVQVGRSACVAVLTVLFVITFALGWEGAAAAMVLSAVVFALLVGAPALRPWVTLRYSSADIIHALRYGGGLIPHTLGTMGIQSVDRFVIAYYAGASENGLYSVGYQIGSVVSLAADAFNRAWSPWLYAGLKENDVAADRRIVRLTYAYFAGIAAVAVLVSVLAPIVIPYVLAPEFHSAGRFVTWIAIGFAFNGMYLGVAGFVFYSERTWVVSWITGASAAVSLALNFTLVPRYGAIGAAQAAAAAFFLKFVLAWIVAQRVRPMPWRFALAGDARAVARSDASVP